MIIYFKVCFVAAITARKNISYSKNCSVQFRSTKMYTGICEVRLKIFQEICVSRIFVKP